MDSLFTSLVDETSRLETLNAGFSSSTAAYAALLSLATVQESSVISQEEHLGNLVKLSHGATLSGLALYYYVLHYDTIVTQYESLASCYSSAVSKLVNDVCQYSDEVKGIRHLVSYLNVFASTISSTHAYRDMEAHGLFDTAVKFYDSGGDTSGKRTATLLLDNVELQFPILKYGDSITSPDSGEPTPVSQNYLTISSGNAIRVRCAYNSNGDFYVQYPVPSTITLDNSVACSTISFAAGVADWYAYGTETYSSANSMATGNMARMFHYRNSLDESGVSYLVFMYGSPATGSATAAAAISAATGGGSWRFASDAIVVKDDPNDTYGNTLTGITAYHSWAAQTDGMAIMLPPVSSDTADLIGSDATSTYNVFDVTLTITGLAYLDVLALDKLT